MGLLSAVVVPLSEQLSTRSLGVVIAAGLFSFCVLAVVLNVLKQLLFKNSNEPPVVFHWFPVFGSTIVYGIDPYKFFFNCRQKVYCTNLPPYPKSVDLSQDSMAMSSPSSYLGKRRLYAWGPKGTTSCSTQS